MKSRGRADVLLEDLTLCLLLCLLLDRQITRVESTVVAFQATY